MMVTASLKSALPLALPLRATQEFELQAQFRRALAAGDGVTGAHCIHEWWMRNAFPSGIEAALTQLWQHAAKSIPDWLPMHYVSWLPLVYEVAARFRAGKPGRRNIYLVRLDYSDRGAALQGIYVGMTAYASGLRFDQHRGGMRAAASVLKRGQELLIGPCCIFSTSRKRTRCALNAILQLRLPMPGFWLKVDTEQELRDATLASCRAGP